MNPGEEYVTPEARVGERIAEQMDDMSGVRGGSQAGMAPYPLYGLEAMGQDGATIPFWRKPAFCYVVGAGVGFGLGYAFFGWFQPKYMKKKKPKKNSGKAKESE